MAKINLRKDRSEQQTSASTLSDYRALGPMSKVSYLTPSDIIIHNGVKYTVKRIYDNEIGPFWRLEGSNKEIITNTLSVGGICNSSQLHEDALLLDVYFRYWDDQSVLNSIVYRAK